MVSIRCTRSRTQAPACRYAFKDSLPEGSMEVASFGFLPDRRSLRAAWTKNNALLAYCGISI